MSSVVLPLLRPSRFGKVRGVAFLVLFLLSVVGSAFGSSGTWLYWGFMIGTGLSKVVTELQQSQRSALLPNLVPTLRKRIPLLMASVIALAGVFSGSVSGPVGASMTLAALGLVCGLPVNDLLLPSQAKSVITVIYLGLFPMLMFSQVLRDLIHRNWIPALSLGLVWLGFVIRRLLDNDTVRKRPFAMPISPPGVAPVHFARRSLSTQSWSGRERFLRLDGAVTTLRGWLRAADFESSFGHHGAALACMTGVSSLALLMMAFAIVAMGDHTGAGATEWHGVVTCFIVTTLDAVDGIFLASIWGLTLLFNSGLCYSFPYPLSRQQRWRVSFLGSLRQHGWIVFFGLFAVGQAILLNVSAARQLVSGSLPGMVRGLLVVSIVAPALQWHGAIGRRNWLQGHPINRPLVALLFLGIYAALPFMWRGVFRTVTLSTELWAYLVFLVISQLTYYLALRQHFSRADLVSASA